MEKQMIVEGIRLIGETTRLDTLVIREGGGLVAPEGWFVQLTVNLSLIHI